MYEKKLYSHAQSPFSYVNFTSFFLLRRILKSFVRFLEICSYFNSLGTKKLYCYQNQLLAKYISSVWGTLSQCLLFYILFPEELERKNILFGDIFPETNNLKTVFDLIRVVHWSQYVFIYL